MLDVAQEAGARVAVELAYPVDNAVDPPPSTPMSHREVITTVVAGMLRLHSLCGQVDEVRPPVVREFKTRTAHVTHHGLLLAW